MAKRKGKGKGSKPAKVQEKETVKKEEPKVQPEEKVEEEQKDWRMGDEPEKSSPSFIGGKSSSLKEDMERKNA